jgi:hypothetical protein
LARSGGITRLGGAAAFVCRPFCRPSRDVDQRRDGLGQFVGRDVGLLESLSSMVWACPSHLTTL